MEMQAKEALYRNKWAILVGVQGYENVKKLNYTQNDIAELGKAFREYLEFEPGNILEFREGEDAPLKPERAVIFHELGKFRASGKVGEEDLLIFYFSGHGMSEEGKDYLLPIAASPYNLALTGITVKDVADELVNTKCNNVIMFIDASREAVEGAKGTSPFGPDSESVSKRAGIVTFFSCDPRDLSYEIKALEHSSFTYSILDGIKKGSFRTVGEINEHLRINVPLINAEHGKPPQQPYAIIEPAEKLDLPVFLSKIQQQEYDLEHLQKMLAELYTKEQLKGRYYSMANRAIRHAMEGKPDKKRLRIIFEVAKGDLVSADLEIAFDALEKQRSGSPSIVS